MEALYNFFYDILFRLGFYGKAGKVLLLGLDNAGKTSLLYMLTEGTMTTHEPTQRPTSEDMKIGNVSLKMFDLGGHEEARETWKDYFVDADLILFLVDAHDRNRLVEANIVLQSLLTNPDMKDTAFVVMGNKIDLPGACSEEELRSALNLQHTTGKGARDMEGRVIEVFMVSILQRFGYEKAIKWGVQWL